MVGVMDKTRLASSAIMPNPVGSVPVFGDSVLSEFSSGNRPDKLGKLSKLSFHDKLDLIRFYYGIDPIANTVVNRIIDIGITGLYLDKKECSDAEYEVYESAIPVFLSYLRKAALEYLLSGLVIPQVTWTRQPAKKLGVKSYRKTIELPDKIWILNPTTIELKFEPFTSEVEAYFKIPDELKQAIKKPSSSTEYTPEILARLKIEFPSLYEAARKGLDVVKLEDITIIRRKPTTYEPYPTPFLQPAIEALEFKRNLRKMDYAIAARVVSAIQLITLGNDNFPLLEEDEDQLEKLRSNMLWRDNVNNVERVFQLFGNHTLQIKWIYPDTSAMMEGKKYDAVNEDIFYALGFPRILVSGETMRSATSQAEFAMFSPAEAIKRIREDLLNYVLKLIEEIQEKNNLKNRAYPKFQELRLYDIQKLSGVASTLYDSGAISLTSLANSAGYSFRDEAYTKASERKLMEKLNIPEIPAKPYSSTPGTPNAPDDNEKPVEDNVDEDNNI